MRWIGESLGNNDPGELGPVRPEVMVISFYTSRVFSSTIKRSRACCLG